jgi:hypothetical protein
VTDQLLRARYRRPQLGPEDHRGRVNAWVSRGVNNVLLYSTSPHIIRCLPPHGAQTPSRCPPPARTGTSIRPTRRRSSTPTGRILLFLKLSRILPNPTSPDNRAFLHNKQRKRTFLDLATSAAGPAANPLGETGCWVMKTPWSRGYIDGQGERAVQVKTSQKTAGESTGLIAAGTSGIRAARRAGETATEEQSKRTSKEMKELGRARAKEIGKAIDGAIARGG